MKPPNSPIQMSKTEARRFILSHQFLLPPKKLAGKSGVLTLIDRLGCIQFDTISVVGRNADLVLQARIQDYTSSLLESMLYQDRTLIDGWDKVASIFKAEDWPFFSRRRVSLGEYYENRAEEPVKMIPEILEHIKTNGPISSLELKGTKKTDWAWGPTTVTRAALELMNAQGTLGIHHRVNTRRYFDLIQNLLPENIINSDDPNRTDQEYLEWHILRRVGGLGLASIQSGEHWLGIQGGRKITERRKAIPLLIEKGLLHPVSIEGVKSEFYIRPQDFEQAQSGLAADTHRHISFIGPLDNLLWDRKMLKDVFDFEYIWEVYKPAKIRQYGYYVLPVLYGDRFIARTEFIFNKKSTELTLAKWWWEEDIQPDDQILKAATYALTHFSQYLGVKRCIIEPSLKHTLPIKDIEIQ